MTLFILLIKLNIEINKEKKLLKPLLLIVK